MKIKDIDYKILNLLLENSRCTINSLSLILDMSLNSVYDRIRRMERFCAIRSYCSLINPIFFRRGMIFLMVVKTEDVGLFEGFEINNVIQFVRGEYFIEAFFSNIYEIKQFKQRFRKKGVIIRSYFVKECIKRNGFLFH